MGRYEGNISRGSLLNLDFLLVPPMSDHHHDHHPDHDDDQVMNTARKDFREK